MSDRTGSPHERDDFAELLRALRAHADMTQAELAAAADVSVAMISKLERGERGASDSMRFQLARALNVPVERLEELEERVAGSRRGQAAGAVPAQESGEYDDEADGGALPPDIEERVREAGLLHRSASVEFPRVAALPFGEIWWVKPTALARDEAGIWINPLSPASRSGDDRVCPRIERLADGRIVLDISRIPDDNRDWGTRAKDQYWIRPEVRDVGRSASEDQGIDPGLIRAYRETALEFSLESTTYIVEPAPEGVTEGPFPHGVERLLVITAWNPESRLLTPLENQERNRMLAGQLERRGHRFVDCVGRSLHDDWSEESFAVINADVDEILELAAEFEQNAIYEWTAEQRLVIWTNSDRATDRTGWTAATKST